MSTDRWHLKQRGGWFAAGREMACALTLLSDAAFKMFVWMCLHAERNQGTLHCTAAEMAQAIGKAEAEIMTSIEELVRKGVCHRTSDTIIEIVDRFWPYERVPSPQP